MTYRGDDLDLRLPPGGAVSEHENHPDIDRRVDPNGTRYRVKAYRNDRTAPVWVDDVVLAVCNAAHEVAQALHSPEVLLQHVVHGMTRIAVASRVLENYGIDINALRRDVTELISSTAARAPSVDLPLTGSEFKAALRLAGDAAGRRGGDTITIDDLLDVLLNYDTDHPGVALLHEHVRGGGRVRAAPLDDDLARDHRRTAQQASMPRDARSTPPRTEPLYGAADQSHGLRRELGDLVYQLQSDVASYRSETVHMQDALVEQLRGMERGAMSNRGDTDVAPVLSRLQGLERLLEGRLEEVTGRWNLLGDRVKAIDTSLSHQSRDMAELKDTLGAEIRMLGDMLGKFKIDVPDFDENIGARLDTIETMLLERGGEDDADAVELLAEHHAQISSLLEEHRNQIADSMHERERNWTAVNERLNKLEHIMTSQHEAVQSAAADRKRVFSSVNDRLEGLEQLMQAQRQGPGGESFVDMNKTLAHISSAQKTTAEVLDEWRLEMSGDLSVLNNRLETLERNSRRPVAMLETLGTNFRNLKSQMAEKTTAQSQIGMRRPIDDSLWGRFSNWMFGPR